MKAEALHRRERERPRRSQLRSAVEIGILGTGPVGQAVAARLSELGHAVLVGTRDPAATLGRTTPGPFGSAPFKTWQEQRPGIELGTFAQAATHGELLVNATQGAASLEALKAAGEKALEQKILVDITTARGAEMLLPI